jgi:4-hydroxy-4-methyl-2-oxoglutarate aldolase
MKFPSEIDLFKFMEKFFYAEALSDILDAKGYRNCAVSPQAQIRPLFAAAVCAGRVRTLLNSPGKSRDKNPYKLAFELIDSLKPGDVPVTAWQELHEPGIMGELSATAMRKRGARGCLVDGYTRDVRKLITMRFPVFARGASPIDTQGRSAVVDYDCPLLFGGIRVLPGQIVFADFNGIVVVPREIEKEVVEEALKKIRLETRIRSELNSGNRIKSVWDKYGVM